MPYQMVKKLIGLPPYRLVMQCGEVMPNVTVYRFLDKNCKKLAVVRLDEKSEIAGISLVGSPDRDIGDVLQTEDEILCGRDGKPFKLCHDDCWGIYHRI
jgi:hypothetical protein